MIETFEENLQKKTTSVLCQDLVTKLEDINFSVMASMKDADPRTRTVMGKMKNSIYPLLIAAREIQKRQKKAGRAS